MPVSLSAKYFRAMTPLSSLNFPTFVAKIEFKNRLVLQNFVKRACKCFMALAPGLLNLLQQSTRRSIFFRGMRKILPREPSALQRLRL